MKGFPALAVAITLGLVAAVLNWSYLARRSRELAGEKHAFVGIRAKDSNGRPLTIDRGQRLEERHVERLEIPSRHAGSLIDYGVPYAAVQSVVGEQVWRRLPGGSLLLAQDLRTPPQELNLEEDERVVFVPVDTRTFVPSLVSPGDQVWFMLSRPQLQTPTPAGQGDGEDLAAASDGKPQLTRVETVGPFEVLSLGNRLGSSEVLRAAKIPQQQENVMGIRALVDADGRLDEDVRQLMDLLAETDFTPASIMWKPSGTTEQ